ncbi:MAG: tRNA (guanosine(37)-N1)-methyltransferase TrmD [Parachlamydiales bacterium]
MLVDLLTLYPEALTALEVGMVGRAQQKGLLSIRAHQIRDFGEGPHRRVDERPIGGGPGMVMTPGPIERAIASVAQEGSHLVYLTPQGKPLTAQAARRLAQKEHLILLCGHYEGVDQRALEKAEEISVGDVVLSSGLLPAMVLIDATARFIPGVLGHEEGAASDTFEEGLFEHPQYAGPREGVPEILLSGDHGRIARWRKARALEKTHAVRPDLFWEWADPQTRYILGVKNLDESRRFFKELGISYTKKEQGLMIAGSVLLLEGEFGAGMVRLALPPEQFERIKQKVTPSRAASDLLIVEDPDGHEWCLCKERQR